MNSMELLTVDGKDVKRRSAKIAGGCGYADRGTGCIFCEDERKKKNTS